MPSIKKEFSRFVSLTASSRSHCTLLLFGSCGPQQLARCCLGASSNPHRVAGNDNRQPHANGTLRQGRYFPSPHSRGIDLPELQKNHVSATSCGKKDFHVHQWYATAR